MKKHVHIIAAIALVCLLPVAANADVMNGSFETGFPPGWSTVGDASIQTSTIGIAPTDGHFMAFLTTLGRSEVPFSIPGISDEVVLTQFLGISVQEAVSHIPIVTGGTPPFVFSFPLRGSPAGDGSGLKQTINGRAGDILSFDFDYVTTEAGLNGDQAYFVMIPSDGSSKTFSFLNPAEGRVDPSPVDLCERTLSPSDRHLCADRPALFTTITTGWQHASFILPSTGTFTLGFGLWEVADPTLASGLFIDNVTLSVSEPASLALLIVGLGAAIALRR